MPPPFMHTAPPFAAELPVKALSETFTMQFAYIAPPFEPTLLP